MNKGTRNLILMTGTPLTTPEDVFGYCHLLKNGLYKSKVLFDAQHIRGRDMYDRPTGYMNEDQLQVNFMTNGARAFRREIDPDLPEVSYEPMFYELTPDHYQAYKKAAEECLLDIEGQETVDFASQSAITNALQQIIIGYEEYFDDENAKLKAHKQVAAFELVDEVIKSMGGRKLIIFAYYQKAITALLNHCQQYNAVVVNGAMTSKQREANIEKFVNDDSCQILIGQPLSMGSGLDNLKTVCSDVLFLELPMVAKDFVQAVGRIDRNGQKNRCRVMIAVAENTLQVRRQTVLLAKDSQANQIQNPSEVSTQDLKKMIYGG